MRNTPLPCIIRFIPFSTLRRTNRCMSRLRSMEDNTLFRLRRAILDSVKVRLDLLLIIMLRRHPPTRIYTQI